MPVAVHLLLVKDNKVLLDYITTLKKSFDDQDLGDFTSIYRVEE